MWLKYVIIGSILIISLIILISRRVIKSRVLSYSPNILLTILFILLVIIFFKYPGGAAGVVIYGIIGLIIIGLFVYSAIINIAIDLHLYRLVKDKNKNDLDADNWICPQCNHLNYHYNFSCQFCGYKVI